LLAPAIGLTACGDDEADTTTAGQGGQGGGAGGGQGEGICLLNNCSADEHCLGCADGRNTCLEAENRCVACDPNTGEGCPDGQECSAFGLCVPNGLTCPTDGDGNPTVNCDENSDCLACSPMHQVCDTEIGKCQACTATNTQHCLSSDICVDNNDDGRVESCSPKCPANCDDANDCSQCGGTDPANMEQWAHACFQHTCAECSDTFPCAAGEECVNGTCQKPCGILGAAPGTCEGPGDCLSCGDGDDAWTCRTPINSPHGTCIPPVAGCSDLGGVAVLPEPYSDVTNLCSDDADCANVGILYDVGKQIQDLVGGTELDLGFTSVTITSPANVEYKMPICADIEITDTISCGVCVPCEEDADCQPIDIDPLIGDLFKDEPLAQIAFALLADLLWGDEDDHHLNFFCLNVAAGYGACIPCANPLSSCGGGGGGGMGSGSCPHDVCTEGDALDSTVCMGVEGQCVADVCAQDDWCCTEDWDDLCVNLADAECNGICTGAGPCSGDVCTVKATPRLETCDGCTGAICAADPFCCDVEWDQACVDQADPLDAEYIGAACDSAGC
jgi:hypothetical protein